MSCQSRNQSPQAFWSACERPEGPWDNGIESFFFFYGRLHNNRRTSLSVTLFIVKEKIRFPFTVSKIVFNLSQTL